MGQIFTADDSWVGEELGGGPDDGVIHEEAESADDGALRPTRIGVLGVLGLGSGEEALDVGDGFGLREGEFVQLDVELGFEGGEELHAVERGEI